MRSRIKFISLLLAFSTTISSGKAADNRAMEDQNQFQPTLKFQLDELIPTYNAI